MSRSHHKHTPRAPQRPWLSRRQTLEDEQRWSITMEGIFALQERYPERFELYEDVDARLGGHDNPYDEVKDA